MAKEITKTYQVSVKFSYHDGSDIAENDVHVTELREDIKQKIAEAASWQKGNLDANISGSVTES
jgi:hypothetical protein